MSARGAVLGFAAALLIVVLLAGVTETIAAEVVDLTAEEPTSEALIGALEIKGDAPDIITGVAIGVKFAPGSTRLTAEARQTLDALAAALGSAELADQFFLLGGHTDASGKPEDNHRLSYLRALAVNDYLVEKGIDPQRLAAMGYGESQPLPGIDPNDERNRRIQITSQLLDPIPAAVTSTGAAQALPIALEYQIHLRRPDGSHGVFDPTEVAFRAGDRVHLTFAASMTGLFDAYSVTPDGDVTPLGSWTVDRGQNLRMPPAPDALSFEGAGTDLVVLQYYPCETVRTRSLDLGQEVLSALPDCADLAQRAFQPDRTRDLAVASNDEGSSTMFLVPIDDVPGVAIRGLSLAIPLEH